MRMINAVGREIPDYLLENGREVYQGKNKKDGQYVKKASPRTRRGEKPMDSKLCASIREACEKCGAHDGMTFSFHTEFRDGDYVASMVCRVLVEEMGLKDLHVAATSLGSAQDVFADYMERCISTSPSWRLPPRTAAETPREPAAKTTAAPWDSQTMTPATPTTR